MKSFILLAFFSLLTFLQPYGVYSQTASPATPSATTSPAVDYNLPYPGILPDHPLFFLKKVRDKILIWFTLDQVKKNQLYLLLADKQLVMGQLLWEKKKFELGNTSLFQAENYLLLSALTLTNEGKNKINAQGLVDKLELAAKKHEEVLLELKTTTVDNAILKAVNEALGINNQAKQKILSLKSKSS